MEKLLLKLYENNVRINLEGDQLKINFPKGFNADSLVNEIKENKDALITHIRQISSKKLGYTPILPAAKKDYYALSSVQKRLYFLYKFDSQSLAYNMPQVVRLTGPLDSEKIVSVFRSLISHYEILRTRIQVISEIPVQQVLDHIDFNLEEYTCTEDEAEGILAGFVRPFNLEQGPLLRVCLLKISDSEHILALDMHHIITDGVSNGILFHSFMSLYRGGSLPVLPIQYKDYSEWQQNQENQAGLEIQRKFWLDQFKEEVPVIDLPSDYSRPVIKGYQGDMVNFSLSKQQTQALKILSHRTRGTLFMTTLSLYYILLGKLTGQQDIVIGTPVAGRDHVDLEHQLGMFVNTLALRKTFEGNDQYIHFLESVKSLTLDCFSSQLYQYESLLDELKVVRDTGRNPLFDVMFSYQNFENPEFSMEGLVVSPYTNNHSDSKFDMSLTVLEKEDQLLLSLEYSTDLFKKESIERFTEYYLKIVDSVTANPEIKIKDIQMIPERELNTILNDFNNTDTNYQNEKSLLELFEEQVILNRNRIAVQCEEKSLTYDQLNREINKLSHYLISNGTDMGDVIGIYFERGPEMITALMAVLKSGAAYIALDPEYPVNRIKTIADESKMKIIITNLSYKFEKSNIGAEIIDINSDSKIIEDAPDYSPSVSVTQNDAAYIIYTSGSTGIPKGIIIEHGSVLDYIFTFKKFFSITGEDKVIQQSSLSFDTSVEEIFPALISGASVIILPSGGRDTEKIIETINSHGATVLSTTPLVLQQLNMDSHQLGESLRVIISGGDSLSSSHVNNLIKKYPVYNTYGPSESTVCVTYYKLEELSSISLIGKPIANRKVFILDQYGYPCPVSVMGEIHVSGNGLARGYLSNEILTREKFIESKNINGRRIYCTGDMGKFLPDGNIQFLGRKDNQLKIRGYRIELEEIETKLMMHPDITKAIVVCKENQEHKYLVGYYTSERILEDLDLKIFLSLTFPDYMIPVSYSIIAEIPMTINGKPDRKKLADLEMPMQKIYIEPADETEKMLQKIWSDVLHIDATLISTGRSFFELGGQSLKAVTLVNKIERVWDIKITLQEIFYHNTIRLMAKIIEGHIWLDSKTEDNKNNNKIIL